MPGLEGARVGAMRLRTSDGQDLGAWIVRAEGRYSASHTTRKPTSKTRCHGQ